MPSVPPEAVGLPRGDDGSPVFDEPWQAQVFAMAVKLHEAGCFSWSEWSDRLAEEIERAQRAGDPDLGDSYYHHWLATLERIVTEKRLIDAAELAQRAEDWAEAARRTPHGQPIKLAEE